MAFKDKSKTIAYNNEFNKTAYDRIGLMLPKGSKEEIKAAADRIGESVNGYIKIAIREKMDREKLNQDKSE